MKKTYEAPMISSIDDGMEPMVSPVVVLWLGAAVYGALAAAWATYLAVHTKVVVTPTD